ncbi:MAG: DNA polymerase III subunit chi [Sandaracinobacter sp.]
MAIDISFYHCTRAPANEVAIRLAEKALAGGQRLLVISARERLETLDRLLWIHTDHSFLPHALAGGAHDADQPILLSEAAEPANGARLLLSLEAGLPTALEGFDRLLNLFEDGTPAHTRARADWKALSARDGVERSYWQQTERGGWQKQA